MTSEKFINEKEAAALTGLSVGTLRKHRQEMRGIRYAKVGKSVRYACSDILAYMESKMITPLCADSKED